MKINCWTSGRFEKGRKWNCIGPVWFSSPMEPGHGTAEREEMRGVDSPQPPRAGQVHTAIQTLRFNIKECYLFLEKSRDLDNLPKNTRNPSC